MNDDNRHPNIQTNLSDMGKWDVQTWYVTVTRWVGMQTQGNSLLGADMKNISVPMVRQGGPGSKHLKHHRPQGAHQPQWKSKIPYVKHALDLIRC